MRPPFTVSLPWLSSRCFLREHNFLEHSSSPTGFSSIQNIYQPFVNSIVLTALNGSQFNTLYEVSITQHNRHTEWYDSRSEKEEVIFGSFRHCTLLGWAHSSPISSTLLHPLLSKRMTGDLSGSLPQWFLNADCEFNSPAHWVSWLCFFFSSKMKIVPEMSSENSRSSIPLYLLFMNQAYGQGVVTEAFLVILSPLFLGT